MRLMGTEDSEGRAEWLTSPVFLSCGGIGVDGSAWELHLCSSFWCSISTSVGSVSSPEFSLAIA